MPTPSRFAVLVPALALLLVGVGCRTVGDQLANQAVQPIDTAVDAMDKGNDAAAEAEAAQYRALEAASDEVTYAMMVLDGETPPTGTEVLPGTVGCGDRVAYVKQLRASSTGDALNDALITLFGVKNNPEGLHNALAKSTLTLDSTQSPDGVTTEVWLSGKVVLGGVCDAPRVKAQLERTISRFHPKYTIFLNGSEAEYRCLGNESGECK